MVDKEIIKALEISSVALMHDEKVSLYKLALDLINRQQAEIDKLAEEYSELITEKDELFDIAEKQKAKIERLEYEIMKTKLEKHLLNETVEEIKSEAIKEFAERLCKDRVSNDPVVIAVKCELKEMVGEDK